MNVTNVLTTYTNKMKTALPVSSCELGNEDVGMCISQVSSEKHNQWYVCVCVYVCASLCLCIDIYYKELIHMIREAGKSQDLQGESPAGDSGGLMV